jgi:hypothetical protein
MLAPAREGPFAFREHAAAKVAAHGLKQVEYTSRYHLGVGTRRR